MNELTADELEQVGVPTLAAVLAAVPRRAFLDVELKGDPGRGAFEALVAGRGPGLERAVVSSFEPGALRRIARLGADVAALAQLPRLRRRRRSPGPWSWVVAASPSSGERWTRGRSSGRTTRVSRSPRGPCVAARPTAAWSAWACRDLRRGRGARRLTSARAIAAARRARAKRLGLAGCLSSGDEQTDRADLVVVGAGTIGGWASGFAARDGAGRVVVLERGLAGQGASAAPPASSAPRAGRRRPSPSAAGRSTSTAARPANSARTAGSASSAT